MKTLSIDTSNKKQVLDITEQVNAVIAQSKAENGICMVFVHHTTAAITSADLDPGTDLDMLDAFEAMIPRLEYRHPHNPSHVGDHIMASIIGSSESFPIEKGQLMLGTWQRVVLVELDGPRKRQVSVHCSG